MGCWVRVLCVPKGQLWSGDTASQCVVHGDKCVLSPCRVGCSGLGHSDGAGGSVQVGQCCQLSLGHPAPREDEEGCVCSVQAWWDQLMLSIDMWGYPSALDSGSSHVLHPPGMAGCSMPCSRTWNLGVCCARGLQGSQGSVRLR